jgi:hypothetical protein
MLIKHARSPREGPILHSLVALDATMQRVTSPGALLTLLGNGIRAMYIWTDCKGASSQAGHRRTGGSNGIATRI